MRSLHRVCGSFAVARVGAEWQTIWGKLSSANDVDSEMRQDIQSTARYEGRILRRHLARNERVLDGQFAIQVVSSTLRLG